MSNRSYRLPCHHQATGHAAESECRLELCADELVAFFIGGGGEALWSAAAAASAASDRMIEH